MADPQPTTSVWPPTRFDGLRAKPLASSTGAVLVQTNAGPGYLKSLGNPEGPHALACEYVGSSLAEIFGLSVPKFAILTLEEVDCYELPKGGKTHPGPAFFSLEVAGRTWSGSAAELAAVENTVDITRMMVFDNCVRNCDRHLPKSSSRKPNLRNVFLGNAASPDRLRLYAIDHTHCFDPRPELTKKLADISNVRDAGVYGLFPAFEPHINPGVLAWCRGELEGLNRDRVAEIVDELPAEWHVSAEVRKALANLIISRAAHLVSIMNKDGWWRA